MKEDGLLLKEQVLHEIPVTILDLSDVESLEVAIVENIQRDDLNPIEEAKGYKRLNEEFKYDHESISKLMSKSRSHISNTLRLLTLTKRCNCNVRRRHFNFWSS